MKIIKNNMTQMLNQISNNNRVSLKKKEFLGNLIILEIL